MDIITRITRQRGKMQIVISEQETIVVPLSLFRENIFLALTQSIEPPCRSPSSFAFHSITLSGKMSVSSPVFVPRYAIL